MATKLKDLEPELQRVAKLIYAGKMKAGDVDKKMIRKVAEQLMRGVFTGYGKSFDDKLTAKEFSVLQKVEQNVYVFSGFKNYQELKEASMMLMDEKGQFKDFKQFLSDVKTVDATYSEVYLDAEYDTAIASAQAIDRWEQIMADIKHSPNLTYRTSGGDVCPICAPLDGLTYPANSPFWDIYMYPNHFRCACDVEQSDADISEVPLSDLPELAPMFRNNVGKTGIVFPESHPYFQEVSKADKKNIIAAVKEVTPERTLKQSIVEEASYKVINAEADKIIKNQIEILTNDYPNSTLKTFYGIRGRTSIAEAITGKNMGFNPKYFNKLQHFESVIKKSVESGHFHKSMTINGIIEHEFGHILTSAALPINVKGETEFKTELNKIFNDYRKSLNESTKKGIKWVDNPDFISKYSHTNLREFAAESFSYARSDKNASPYAKQVLSLINKYFK
jgi:hypothetical protein